MKIKKYHAHGEDGDAEQDDGEGQARLRREINGKREMER
jgi:hypothetical protein